MEIRVISDLHIDVNEEIPLNQKTVVMPMTFCY